MKDQPHGFSVVVPLYNKGKEVLRAIQSVLNQTYSEFEIIVVNDGSTDKGPEVVKNIKDTRIRLIDQANAGVSVARNRGIKEATFNYISFLDADDEWAPDYLSTIRSLIFAFPDAGLYATAYTFIDEKGDRSVPHYKGIPPSPWQGYIPSYFYSALGIPPVWTSAVTIPVGVFSEVGMFPEGVVIAQDKDLWERIALQYEICFSNDVCANYYLNAGNRSCVRNLEVPRQRPFFDIAQKVIEQGRLPDRKMKDFLNYVTYCQYQRAKVLMLYHKQSGTVRDILAETKPQDYRMKLEKGFLVLLSYVPQSILKTAWQFSQRIKN